MTSYNTLLTFDIETLADPAAVALLPDPKPAANLKDPVKIAADIEDKKAERLAMAALDPDIATIKAISLTSGKLSDALVLIVDKDHTEKEVITEFWKRFTGRSCGYNILGFDWPFILRRSFDLGLSACIKNRPVLAKYRTDSTIDLMGILYNWDRAKALKTVAKRYNLEVLAPDCDGSMVAQMSDIDIRAYCLSDLWITLQLYEKMSGIYF